MSGAALASAFVEITPETTGLGDKIAKGIWKAIGDADLDKSGKKAGDELVRGADGKLRDAKEKFAKSGEEAGREWGRGMGGGLKGVLGSLGPGLLAGGIASVAVLGVSQLTGSLGGLVNQARQSESAARITEQVIKTTGGAAKITAAQIGDLSTAISNKTGVDDDAVRASANMLLTFTSVKNEVGKGNDIFNQATRTVTDMSVALGQDGKSSAIQLGKALNDPINGVSALQRVGVSFTAQQKTQIATLVKHGNVLGAQKIILKELGHEFGGAAAAASDPMKKLGVTLGNVGKGLAAELLPWLDKAATWLNAVGVPAFMKFTDWLGTHVGPIIGVVAGFVMNTLVPALGTVGGFITGTVIPGVMGLAHAFMENIWPALQRVWGMIASNLQPAIQALAGFWTGTLLPGLQAAWPIVQKIATILGVLIAAIAVAVSWILGKLVPALTWVVGKVAPVVIAAVGKIVDAIMWIPGAAKTAWENISTWFGNVVDFIAGLGVKIRGVASGMWDGIKDAFKAVINWIIDRWNSISFNTPDVPGTDWGGQHIAVPQIPHLAHGGIVPATRGGQLVVAGEAGEDEIVTSRSEMRRFMGGAGGGIVVHVDARGADPAAAAAFRASARQIAMDVIVGVAREVANT